MVYVCLLCKKQDSSRKSLVKHVYNHYTEMICRLCKKTFSSPSNWRRHLRVVHPDQAEELIQQEKENKLNSTIDNSGMDEEFGVEGDELDDTYTENDSTMNPLLMVDAQLDHTDEQQGRKQLF